MRSNTVAQFAAELKVPPTMLLEQLRAAGVDKHGEDDGLTDELRVAHHGAVARDRQLDGDLVHLAQRVRPALRAGSVEVWRRQGPEIPEHRKTIGRVVQPKVTGR